MSIGNEIGGNGVYSSTRREIRNIDSRVRGVKDLMRLSCVISVINCKFVLNSKLNSADSYLQLQQNLKSNFNIINICVGKYV